MQWSTEHGHVLDKIGAAVFHLTLLDRQNRLDGIVHGNRDSLVLLEGLDLRDGAKANSATSGSGSGSSRLSAPVRAGESLAASGRVHDFVLEAILSLGDGGRVDDVPGTLVLANALVFTVRPALLILAAPVAFFPLLPRGDIVIDSAVG